MRPAKIPISLRICAVWSESSLCAVWIVTGAMFLQWVDRYTDQIARRHRMIWGFVWRACQKGMLISFIKDIRDDTKDVPQPRSTRFTRHPLRKHTYSNTLKMLQPKNENFQIIKNLTFFHISAQIIDCGYLLEPPRRGGSNEYHNLCFSKISKVMYTPVNSTFTI